MSPRPRLPAGLRRLLAARLARPAEPAGAVSDRRAVLFKVDRLGDFVLALGALRRLIEHYGGDQCRLIVSGVAAPVAAAEFPGVARWELPSDAAGLWRDIRPLRRQHAAEWAGERYAELVCLRHQRTAYRDIPLGWLNARAWHGLGPRPAPGRLALDQRPNPPIEYPAAADAPWCRELLAHRAVVASVTGRTPAWSDLRPAFRSRHATAGPDLIWCPFGGDRIRDYPLDHWIAAWRTAALPPAPVRLIGPGARATELAVLAERLRREAGRPEVTLATDLAPLEFIARLAAARGVVTVESAAAHLATAFDKPAVILIGGGHPGWLAPWGEGGRQRWVAHPLDCFHCNWSCRHPTVRCLVDLPPAAVAAALRGLFTHG